VAINNTSVFSFTVRNFQPMPIAARSKAWFCGHSLAGIVASIAPRRGYVSLVNAVLLGRGSRDGPITRPEEFYRV
jgi:hypothetical protein